jgi:hypothetical protein
VTNGSRHGAINLCFSKAKPRVSDVASRFESRRHSMRSWTSCWNHYAIRIRSTDTQTASDEFFLGRHGNPYCGGRNFLALLLILGAGSFFHP